MANDKVAVVDGGDFGAVQVYQQEAGIGAAEARETASIRTMTQMAMMRPRNEKACWEAIMQSAKRPTFAVKAEYRFPRGAKDVSGPSVHVAREAARCWGNVRTGVEIVTADEKQVHIRGFAHDLQTNTRVDVEAKFSKLVQRKRTDADGNKATIWVEPDERDLRELVNKHGAICVRNAILQLLPADLVEDAVNESRRTMVAVESKSLKEDKGTTIKRLIATFGEIYVTVAMLEAFLSHGLDTISAEELQGLRAVYTSIKDGNSKPADYFNGEGKPAPADKNLDDVKERLKAKGTAPAPAVATPTAPLTDVKAGGMSKDESDRLDREAAQAEAH